MKRILKAFSLILALLLISCKNTSEQPNVIIIFTDDQRVNTLTAYDANCPIQTPNIDGLAEKGHIFLNAFVTTPICAVSRSSVLTGRYATNHRMHQFVTAMDDSVFANAYHHYLRKAGYFVGQFGKYGIGFTDEQAKSFDLFDADPAQGPAFRELNGELLHDAEWLTRKTQEFLEVAPKDKPFCLQLNYKEPHPSSKPAPEDDEVLSNYNFQRSPYDKDEYYEKLPEFVKEGIGVYSEGGGFGTKEGMNDHMRDYFEKILSVDRSVGKIRKMIEDRGLSDNTIIIYFSDHGTHHGEKHLLGKWRPYEESLRIPMIIYDPRNNDAGEGVHDEMVLNIDIAPTILNLAGIDPPEIMDGKSLIPVMQRQNKALRDHFFFEHYCSPHMISTYVPRNVGVRFKDSKYLKWIEVDADPSKIIEEYYDLSKDPGEVRNLINNPDYQSQISDARALFDSWRLENPSSFQYDVFGSRAQFGAPEIDWEKFKEVKPEAYKRIATAIKELGTTFDNAMTDWDVRLEVSKKANYFY